MQDQVILGRRGGRSPKRPYRFSMAEIALVKGKSLSAVRADRQRGKFDPRDLASLVGYLKEVA